MGGISGHVVTSWIRAKYDYLLFYAPEKDTVTVVHNEHSPAVVYVVL